MSSPSVTYTLTNGTTADATQVAQNFTDLVNALTDGLKDITIGTLAVNGNVALGDASSDVVTFTASLGSTILPSASNTYDLGSSSFLFKRLYFGTQILAPDGSSSAPSYSFSSDSTTGMYFTATSTINFACGGTLKALFSSGTTELRTNSLKFGSQASAANVQIVVGGVTNGLLNLSGSSTVGVGAGLTLYGSTNGSAPSVTQFTSDGTVNGSISSAGAWTLGASGGTQTHAILGNQIYLQSSGAGNSSEIQAYNPDNTNGASHATLMAVSGGTSGGDAKTIYRITSGSDWSVGADNSSSDSFKVSQNAALGTNDFLTCTTAGAWTIGASGGTQTHALNGNLQATGLLGVKQGTNNVTDALPTQAEMVTQFGAASVGTGMIGVIKDANADTNFFICISNGTSWYALKMTKGA